MTSKRILLCGLCLGIVMPAASWAEAPATAQAQAAAQAPSEAPPPAGARGPAELEGIDIVDRAGDSVPGDILLVDERGKPVRFGEVYDRGRPILVQLVYYQCPMLCSLVLNGFVAGARPIDWIPGRDYEVVTVSFDPRDSAGVAAKKKANYVEALGKPEAEAGWHFLTGSETEVRRLADALGFRYRWVEDQHEFAHAAGMFVLTPEGRVSRTLYGIEFAPRDIRLSLVEAGEGKLGSPFDHLLLFCFQYDSKKHTYALVARNIMKVGGILTMLVLGTLVGMLWSRERRRLRPAVRMN